MAIVRWDPFRELEDMSHRLNNLITRPRFGNGDGGGEWAPMVDIVEAGNEFLIKAELPEVKKEDIKIHVENGVLTLEGERRSEREESGKTYHRTERSYGRFMRSFALPENVDPTKVRAEHRDGMLIVHITKSAAQTPKAIDVKVS